MTTKIPYQETTFGFIWGAARVERFFSDEKGWVTVGLTTRKYPNGLQIYVTKTGKVRIFDGNKEWKKP